MKKGKKKMNHMRVQRILVAAAILLYSVVQSDSLTFAASAAVTANETIATEMDYKETADGLEIYTLAGLEYFRDSVNDGNTYAGKTVLLKSDIDMASGGYGVEKINDGSLKSWIPIGDLHAHFKGIFDGEENKIKNIYINTSRYYQGLFGYVEDGTVKNVTIESGSITAGAYVGGIIGQNDGDLDGTLESGFVVNCYNGASITATSNLYGGNVGGIIGYSKNSTIRECHNTGNICDIENNVGGVAGEIRNSVITDCFNDGKVEGTKYVGGITGSAISSLVMRCHNTGSIEGSGLENAHQSVGGVTGGTIANSSVEICYNTGSVKGSGDAVGGVTGVNGGEVTHCYNTGDVMGNDFIGGVVGKNQDSKTSAGTSSNNRVIVENCYNTGNVDGATYVGGVAGMSSDSKQDMISNCHNTGSVKGSGYVGGVIGVGHYGGTVNNCYNIGAVESSDIAGGVVGTINNNYTTKNCYTVGGTVSKNTTTNNVVGKNLSNGVVENCYYFLDKTDDGTTLNITATYKEGAVQNLSDRIEIHSAIRTETVSSCSYNIQDGNEQLNAVISDGILTIPPDTPAGVYALGIEATVTATNENATTNTLSLLLPFTVTIEKAQPQVTAPTANNRIYDGSAQPLISAGNSTGGTMQYSLSEDGTYTSEIPTETDAGEYTVYYRIDGGSNYQNTDAACVNVTIEKKTLTASIEGANTSKTYDGTASVTNPDELSIRLDGVIEGDEDKVSATASYEYNSAKVTEANAIIAKNITLSGEKAGNYQLSDAPVMVDGSITKSSPSIAFRNTYSRSKIYDGKTTANPTADDLTLTGTLFSDVTFSWDKTPLNVGVYTLTASIADTADHGSAVASMNVSIGKAKQPASFPPSNIKASNKCTKIGKVSLPQGWEWKQSVRNKKLKVGKAVTATAIYNGTDKGNYETETTTVTVTRKPGTPVIKKLENQSGKKVSVTIKKKISGAFGYQVAYATKSSMKGSKIKTFKKTSVTLNKLKKNKKYYIRVRAYAKKNGRKTYGNWSKIKRIEVRK